MLICSFVDRHVFAAVENAAVDVVYKCLFQTPLWTGLVYTQKWVADHLVMVFVTFGGAAVQFRAAAAPFPVAPVTAGVVGKHRAWAAARALLWPLRRVPCPGRAWQGR